MANSQAKRKNFILVALAALSLQFLASGNGFVSPALADLTTWYAGANPATVLQLGSIPSLLAIPTSIIFGAIAGNKLSYRATGLLGTGCFAVFGIAPYFFGTNLTLALVSRCFYGLAYGIVVAIMSAVIIRLFEGETQARLLGYGSVVLALGGVIMPYIAGILTVKSPNLVWWTYLAGAVSFILILVGLPEPEKVEAAAPDPSLESVQKSGPSIPGRAWGYIVGYGLDTLAMYGVFLGGSSVIVGEALGDAKTAGSLISIYFVGGFIGGLIFARYLKLTGRYSMSIGNFVCAIGMFLMYIGHNIPLMFFGFFCVGLAFSGWLVPGCYSGLGQTVSPAKIALAGGLAAAATNIGGYIASFMIPISSSIMHNDSPRASFFVGSIIYLLLAVYFFIAKPKKA